MSRIRISAPRHRISFAGMFIASLILWAILVSIAIYIGSAESISQRSPQRSLNDVSNYSGKILDIHDYRETVVLNNLSGYYLLYFEQKDCPGCKEISPAVEKYFSGNNSQVGLVRIHIDDIFNSNQDEALRLISRYGVLGTPTLILLHDGVEVARHIGIFTGDQYEGLKAFIKSGVRSSAASKGFSLSPAISLGLGVLAAVSPCSLPMIALFAMASRGSGINIMGVAKTLASLILVLIPASLGLGVLFTFGRVFGVSIYYSLITYIGILSLLWGILTLANREPMVSVGGRASLFLPILGMQCSFPFLLAVLSIAPRSPVDALINSALFSMGYIAPYMAANLLSRSPGKPGRNFVAISSGKTNLIFRYLQGIILISVGIYVVMNGLPYIAS